MGPGADRTAFTHWRLTPLVKFVSLFYSLKKNTDAAYSSLNDFLFSVLNWTPHGHRFKKPPKYTLCVVTFRLLSLSPKNTVQISTRKVSTLVCRTFGFSFLGHNSSFQFIAKDMGKNCMGCVGEWVGVCGGCPIIIAGVVRLNVTTSR